ncbi:hypothetical protein EXIGUO9Y_210080 [Exiguobacterium oxidotolerans]|uniref:Uncharacterized protein n=1 Tax=Exiguobacterium oxidotolerans TaxID=223958 RepID=A0A653I8H9_9BACL|nr:hypothetical protein EXIGUO9Y_210080 [Exiguobacterium oxidotolerans]
MNGVWVFAWDQDIFRIGKWS